MQQNIFISLYLDLNSMAVFSLLFICRPKQ